MRLSKENLTLNEELQNLSQAKNDLATHAEGLSKENLTLNEELQNLNQAKKRACKAC